MDRRTGIEASRPADASVLLCNFCFGSVWERGESVEGISASHVVSGNIGGGGSVSLLFFIHEGYACPSLNCHLGCMYASRDWKESSVWLKMSFCSFAMEVSSLRTLPR